MKNKYPIGSRWKCRDGGEAVVVRYNREFVVAYVISTEDGWYFNSDGTCRGNELDKYDLIEPWVEKRKGEFWVNVYPCGPSGIMNDSEEEADRLADKNRIACVRVQWTEGEGV